MSRGPDWSSGVLASVKMVLTGLRESSLVSRGPGWSSGVLASVKMAWLVLGSLASVKMVLAGLGESSLVSRWSWLVLTAIQRMRSDEV